MKKVVLLGDSIRLNGYGKKVPELLGDAYSVWQPDDNCRFSQYTLRGVWDWRWQIHDADVVHWNNGLWDVCELLDDGPFTPLNVYVDNMLRIATYLQKHVKKVIFATTTPVTEANLFNKNSYIEEYNHAIVPRLAELGVQINDLYALCAPHIDTYISQEDNIHLTVEGIDACAQAVAAAIRAAE